MSYGSGDYWGIINVGNGLNYINNYKDENVEKVTTTSIVISNNEKYLFENIDKPQSPINVLIGSRKFAEGWNCFRVSVIGLINLGKTKGNKIIQIFGRGVRLKGLKNDGKRKHISHIDDYFKDLRIDNDSNNLKKLETLCVFSLQKSYLEVFTEAISGELEITKSFDISVKPRTFEYKDGKLTYMSEAKETFEYWANSKQLPKINGINVNLNPSKTYDSPYLSMEHGSNKAVITYPGRENLTLDFNAK